MLSSYVSSVFFSLYVLIHPMNRSSFRYTWEDEKAACLIQTRNQNAGAARLTAVSSQQGRVSVLVRNLLSQPSQSARIIHLENETGRVSVPGGG